MLDYVSSGKLGPSVIAIGAVLLLVSLLAFLWVARHKRGAREAVDRALGELRRRAAPSPLVPGRERGTLELPEPAEVTEISQVRVLIRVGDSERKFVVPRSGVGEIEGCARDLGYVVMYRGNSSSPRWDLWTTG